MKKAIAAHRNAVVVLLLWLAFVQSDFADEAGAPQFEFRAYPIQPGVFKTLIEIPDDSAPSAVVSSNRPAVVVRDDDIKKFFVEAGVPFPAGSMISHNARQNLLIVRNTAENLDLLERVIGRGPCIEPTQVAIEARFLQMTRETANDLFKPEVMLGRVSVIKEETLRRIRELEGQKKITVLAQPKLTTVSGNTAQVKSAQEIRYATNDAYAPRAATNWPGTSAEGHPEGCGYPGGFETREIGAMLNATPTIGPDGQTINLTLVPELSSRIEPPTKIEVLTPNGKVTVEQPRFRSRQVTTTVQMLSGTTILMAVADPIEGEDPSLVILILLTATVVGIQ